jgi:hypothetical protein
MYLFEEPNPELNSRFHFCVGPEQVLKKKLKLEPGSGVFIQVKNRSTLVGYSVPSGKKKNLRPMSAMPPSRSPFWDKGGKKDACKKKNVDHKKK